MNDTAKFAEDIAITALTIAVATPAKPQPARPAKKTVKRAGQTFAGGRTYGGW